MNNRSSTGSQAGRRNASVPGQVNPVVYILSLLVGGLGATMVIPLLVEWAAPEAHPTMFAVPMLAAVGTGIVLFAATRSDADLELDHRQAFIVTAGSLDDPARLRRHPLRVCRTGLDRCDLRGRIGPDNDGLDRGAGAGCLAGQPSALALLPAMDRRCRHHRHRGGASALHAGGRHAVVQGGKLRPFREVRGARPCLRGADPGDLSVHDGGLCGAVRQFRHVRLRCDQPRDDNALHRRILDPTMPASPSSSRARCTPSRSSS